MSTPRTSLVTRLVAAAASAATTFVLLSSVVSLSEPRGDRAALQWAAASSPTVR